MGDPKLPSNLNKITKHNVESEKQSSPKTSPSATLGIPHRSRNGRKLQHTLSCPVPAAKVNEKTDEGTPKTPRKQDEPIMKRHRRCPTEGALLTTGSPAGRPSSARSCPNDPTCESKPGPSRNHVTIVETDMKNELPRIRNYQIKSVKKGVPIIDPKDEAVQKIMMKKKDLRITPYWICQKKKDGTKRNATAWIFSIFVTFVCVVFPLTSFASDVAFYVTCSDHYNHTAEILDHVRTEHLESTGLKADYTSYSKLTNRNKKEQNIKKDDASRPPSDVIRPAPLSSKWKRSLSKKNMPRDRRIKKSTDVLNTNIPTKKTYYTRPKYRIRHKTFYHYHKIRKENAVTRTNDFPHRSLRDPSYYNKEQYQNEDSRMRPRKNSKNMVSQKGTSVFRQTNFEIEEYNMNQSTACDSPPAVISYMLTDKAAEELEAHRHVTIDIFEPVFILGSFPSLILCILTRLVVLVTGHKNFLSAYVINMACMPLQLITGALSVHSASYHLGRKGFECWHCALDGDCSDMIPLWWLQDGVTKTLLVSIFTKIVDGIAGGLVLFIVIIRLLWPDGGHATFWWNMLRGFVMFIAFLSCITVSPLLVITPTMSVMRLEFMELATPFPGREGLLSAFTVIMSLGLAAWCLSFGVLFIYVTYSMYLYCRERTIDH